MLSVPIDRVESLIIDALCCEGVSRDNASSVARALVAAEIDGQAGHGLSRVNSYLAQAKSGKVSGDAIPEIRQTADAIVSIDAGFGFAYPAIETAITELKKLAPVKGIAAASLFHSHHAGQLCQHVEALADAGLVALMFANTPHAIAPWGGDKSVFGTNPIAFAAPRQDKPSLVIDLSLSKVARGKVMKAAQRGEPIPDDWALDAEGNPTTDPVAALGGTMLPMGEAKGSALALMVEILAAVLTGANLSAEASSFFDAKGAPPGVGQLIIAISPEAFGHTNFTDRLEQLLAMIEEQQGTRLPGSKRVAQRSLTNNGTLEIGEEAFNTLKDRINT